MSIQGTVLSYCVTAEGRGNREALVFEVQNVSGQVRLLHCCANHEQKAKFIREAFRYGWQITALFTGRGAARELCVDGQHREIPLATVVHVHRATMTRQDPGAIAVAASAQGQSRQGSDRKVPSAPYS